MKIYNKYRSIERQLKQRGFCGAIYYYMNRAKEAERALQMIQKYHLPKEEELEKQRDTEWRNTPLISIITPLYNTPERFLIELIKSVQAQTYSNWELCLADGSESNHSEVGQICHSFAQEDSRIIYKKLERNEGIVGNTNHCIELSSGEYLGLLDHDDLLHPSALFEAVKAIDHGADFIFTDEMKFHHSVEESKDIVCKNSYGKDELRAHNYICHFVVFEASLLEEVEHLYRFKYEGSQDYDMALRLTECAKKIVHIPKVLYYWRVHQGSVSMNLSGKHYAVDAAKRAITDQLKRSGESGQVECNLPYETIYRIHYNIERFPVISVILKGSWKQQSIEKYLGRFLKNTSYRPIQIVCNQGESISFDRPGISFSRKATGEYLLFMAEDCVPLHDFWVEELLMYAQRKDVGCVGPWILYKNGTTCFAGAVLDEQEMSGIHVVNRRLVETEQGYEANMRHVRNTTILSERCFMVSRKVYEELGGFDPNMKTYRDADFCIRSKKAGYWNVWTCFAKIECRRKAKKDYIWNEYQPFRHKWAEELAKKDDYYHPLLKELKWM